MKGREGEPEKGAFGPAKAPGTAWAITTKTGAECVSRASTAFMACAQVGLTLGQVADIKPL